ncbi:trypsin-like peptidase domain-containing protein [Phenylobacterium sp.]|uniref:S1C family serine protease n=1 Tax=Phenylobacterium sp. TaxID=1871053 RepID=UPI001225C31D|nr:trypsin-like peptidase domain-containing protein [Phenylobacterium sp.]THD58854.1 MAG: serine protease [Phenylobacterium sp.]
MKLLNSALAALAISVCSPALGWAEIPTPAVVTVPALPPESKPKPVALARAKAQIADNLMVGYIEAGIVCIRPQVYIPWKQVSPNFSRLKDIFGEELKAAGFKPDSDPGNLFPDQEASLTDLQVGALFKSADVDICKTTFHLTQTVRVEIEWQVYSTLRREVVATLVTHEGAQKIRNATDSQEGRTVYQEAFAANVRSLLSNETFRKIVTGPAEAAPSAVVAAAAKTPIVLSGATTRPTSIPDAVGSVVTIFAGSAFGSGVLVSSDGYLLTNHHVVGEMPEVRIRWSDGFETTGRVVRSDKRRDVALVKTEPRGRTALALNRTVPPAGTPVYAVGAPLDPHLQSTVTRGIVSAQRIVDGFSFIQSDTPVTHGNSGGPLLDEHGAVIGLTDWGVPAEKGSSLNFFIPIGDALDFLALKGGG